MGEWVGAGCGNWVSSTAFCDSIWTHHLETTFKALSRGKQFNNVRQFKIICKNIYSYRMLVLTHLFQSGQTTDSRVEKLLDILSRRDDSLLPVFYESLLETDQRNVAKKLGYQGQWVIYYVCDTSEYSYIFMNNDFNHPIFCCALHSKS